MPDEAHARRTLAPIAPHLVEVCAGAWRRYLAEGIPRRNRTTRANIVNDHMHDIAGEILVDSAPRIVLTRDDKPFYAIGGLALRFKLLDQQMRPQNVGTIIQEKISAQRLLPGFIDGDRLTYVSVGYMLDPSEAEVERVVAVRWIRTTLDWWIDLHGLAAGALDPVKPTLPNFPPVDDVPLPTIAASKPDDGAAQSDAG